MELSHQPAPRGGAIAPHEALGLASIARILVIAATLAMGLIAGFFYAYSVSVMRGLALVDDVTFIKAMQAINAAVRNWMFAPSFFGALAISLAAMLAAAVAGRRRAATLVALAALVYGGAAFAVTLLVNVPMNEALGAITLAADTPVQPIRRDYEAKWVAWNHFRTVAATAAFGLLVLACRAERRERA